MAHEDIASNLNDSSNVGAEDAPTDDQETYHEDLDDDDNETIEEEPDLFSSCGDDLFSDNDEQTDTEDELTEIKSKR